MISYHTLIAKLVRSGMDSEPNRSQQWALAENAKCTLGLLARV